MKLTIRAPSRITWHYWIHLLRLLVSLAFGLTLIVLVAMSRLWAPPPASAILLANFNRTDSYIGTVLTQTVASVFLLALPATSIGLTLVGKWSDYFYISYIHIACTLYLSISLLWYKREAGVNAPWKSNAKDVLLGSSSAQSHPSWFGRPRDKRDDSNFTYVWTVYAPRILFRRVGPVESRQYAFFQNFCALLFVVPIIVRASTALAQAQNQIETRNGVGECSYDPLVDNVRVLVRHQSTQGTYGPNPNPQIGQGYDVDVQAAAQGTGQYQPCTSEPQHATSKAGNWFQVFSCTSQNDSYTYFSDATYAIAIRSTNGTSLDAVQLPSIWFADFADTYQPTSAQDQPGFMSSVAPWLVPPWKMIGGRHVNGTISIMERKFITSSVFRDSVASMEPTYKSTHLFTIALVDTTPSADSFTSTALLTPSLVSSPLMYLNSPADVRKDKTGKSDMPTLCALIEDYRSSTIFDAIGSIGGLLALLQGLHILLFGRPLFWGFAGAKLISPFGLFGRCHSRGFRRRLRERYHRQPTGGQTDDPSERFRMNTFLRDFVVNLGPADVDNEEDIELGRSGEPREPDLQNNRDRSHGDGEHDTGDSTLLLSHPGVDHHDYQGRDTSVTTIGSNREP